MDLQEKLLNKKDELQKAIERKKDNLMITVRESTDELSMYDQHPADGPVICMSGKKMPVCWK